MCASGICSNLQPANACQLASHGNVDAFPRVSSVLFKLILKECMTGPDTGLLVTGSANPPAADAWQ